MLQNISTSPGISGLASSAADNASPAQAAGSKAAPAQQQNAPLKPPAGCGMPFQESVFGKFAEALEKKDEASVLQLLKDPEGFKNAYNQMKPGRGSANAAHAMHYASMRGALQHSPKAFAKFFVGGRGELMREKCLNALLQPGVEPPPVAQRFMWRAASDMLEKTIHSEVVYNGRILGGNRTNSNDLDDGEIETDSISVPARAGNKTGNELHLCMESDGAVKKYWPMSRGLVPPETGNDPDGLTMFRSLTEAMQDQSGGAATQEEVNQFRLSLYRHLCENRDTYKKQFDDVQSEHDYYAAATKQCKNFVVHY